MNVDEASRWEDGNIVVLRKRSVPRHEPILKIRHRVPVRVLDHRLLRLRRNTLPCKRIMRRKPRQRADIPNNPEAIKILEEAETHRGRGCR